MLFYLGHLFTIFSKNKIDCSAFAAESPAAANAVDLILMVGWEVVVDHEVALLHVDPACQQVSRNQNATHALAECFHDHRAVVHLQVRVDHPHLEPILAHRLRQQLRTLFSVHLYDAQPNVYFLEQLVDHLLLEVFLGYFTVELADTFQCQFIIFNQNDHRVIHEIIRDAQSVFFQSC